MTTASYKIYKNFYPPTCTVEGVVSGNHELAPLTDFQTTGANSKTVGYSSLKKRGAFIPPTSFSRLSLKHYVPNEQAADFVMPDECSGSRYSGSFIGYTGCDPFQVTGLYPLTMRSDPVAETLVLECTEKVYQNLHQVKVNYAMAFKERKETFSTVADIAGRIGRAALLVKKGRLGKAWKELGYTPKNAGNRWLEYRYGITPLLMDAHGALEDFMSRDDPTRYTISARAFARSELAGLKGRAYSTTYSALGQYTYKNWFESDVFTRCSMRLDYQITDLAAFRLTDTGFGNPALLIWEGIPLSFVADWFFNVGDYLNFYGMQNTGMTYIGGSFTQRREIHTVPTMLVANSYWGTPMGMPTNWQPKVSQEVNRVALLHQPDLTLRFRGLNGLTPKRLLDAVALMVPIFKKKM